MRRTEKAASIRKNRAAIVASGESRTALLEMVTKEEPVFPSAAAMLAAARGRREPAYA